MSAHGKKSKKLERSEKKSDNVAVAHIKALRDGKASHLVLGKVTKVNGDSRFEVVVGKEKVLAHLSKTLHSKGARHRNATMKIAVHVDSYVLLDGDIIRAVVGDSNAQRIKDLTNTGSKKSAKSTNSNNLFNRLGGARYTRKVKRN